MASNLQSAKQAIEAELSHARQGIAYYTACVKALESALHQLQSVEGEGGASSGTKSRASAKNIKTSAAKRARKPRAAAKANGAGQRSGADGPSRQKNSKAKRGTREGMTDASNNASSLPSTGSDFWLRLVARQPLSAVDIANAAIAALGIQPDQKQEIKKLKQRVSPALTGLVSAQKIQDSGAGRERRFFKNENPAD